MAPPPLLSHCSVSPWRLASLEFQDDPTPIILGEVAITERRLWAALDSLETPAARARYFHDYVSVKFSLHAWSEPGLTDSARSSLKHSYVHCLRHWGVDSNGPSGAVLKSWVENRFGLRPTYHAGHLATDPTARERYALDRVRGAARSMGLSQQLDLLYAFCQRELARRHPGERWLTLYRGTHDADEYVVRQVESTETAQPPAAPGSPRAQVPKTGATGRLRRPRNLVVEFNNLSSFSSDPEVAWEFGSSVWRVRVPLAKILCFSGLLPSEFLQGEAEYLVLGGASRVEAPGA